MARRRSQLRFLALTVIMLAAPSPLLAEAPAIATALRLAPLQRGIEYDQPKEEEIASCTIKAEKIDGASAWVVRDRDGVVIRQFLDSNGDNVVDIWSYFRHGLEVYRDVDSDFSKKADQYRWYHTAGSKIGVDSNEDGKIDSWRRLSPEEAAEEVVLALKNNDLERYNRLLLTANDAKQIGLSSEMTKKVAQRTKSAADAFTAMQKGGKIDRDAEFTDFGGLRPGMVPAGTKGSTKDVLVYENAWAMVATGDDHQQLRLGSMVEVDGAWKLIDGPSLGASEQTSAGLFFDAAGPRESANAANATTQPTEEMQKVLTEIQKIDQEIDEASQQRKPALHARRADLIERLAALAEDQQEREQWLMQLASMLGNAYLSGDYPEGADRLKQWEAKLAKSDSDQGLVAHFVFQRMLAEYGRGFSDPKADPLKIQEAWLEQLESFVKQYGQSEHVAEALIQLAMSDEFSGETEQAVKRYQQIVEDFSKSEHAVKARGAVRRLKSEGRSIPLAGQSLNGRPVDLKRYRGKVVLIQYWATSQNAGANDHAELKDLYAKYGGERFDIIGVNLDFNRDEAVSYLRSNNLPWQQLYEPGGFDGRLAKELGVMTAPLMIVVGADGRVVNRDVQLAELEDELKKLLSERVSRRE